MTLSQDILAELAEISPDSPLAVARAVRDAATRHAQGSYEVLFSQQDEDFPPDERFAVAAKVAKLHQADALAAHYAGFGLADPTSARLTPALAFARLLTFSPVEATPSALQALTRAGWTPRGIVTLAADSLRQLPEPVTQRPAVIERKTLCQRRYAGGGRFLAYHPADRKR